MTALILALVVGLYVGEEPSIRAIVIGDSVVAAKCGVSIHRIVKECNVPTPRGSHWEGDHQVQDYWWIIDTVVSYEARLDSTLYDTVKVGRWWATKQAEWRITSLDTIKPELLVADTWYLIAGDTLDMRPSPIKVLH